MHRLIADTHPSTTESVAEEKQRTAWTVLSPEVQLWIEVSILIVFGLVMIYSASSMPALKKFSDAAHYLKRQLLCIGLGLGILVTVRAIPYRSYQKHVGWMLILTILSLGLVLVPGMGVEI